jgi:peptide/nickel transport system ATP-binding protein
MSDKGSTPARESVLEITDFRLAFRVRGRDREAIRGVSFAIGKDESVGLVGESGCGKSTVAFAIVKYLPQNAKILGGSIRVAGQDVFRMDDGDLRELRSTTVSMVYQNPGSALNPSIRIGDQVVEVFRIAGLGKDAALKAAKESLERVQISDPVRVMQRYPHQLSGGMQQRVVIAMALAKNPALLILDEPTTGLDATVEAEVLDLVNKLRQETHISVLLISHNLGLVARMCSRVGILYAGRMVEEGATEALFRDPRHPYTVGLLRAVPRWGTSKTHGILDTIPGLPPAIGAVIPGCVYADRCGIVEDRCRKEEPPLYDLGGGRLSRCFFHERAHLLPKVEAPPRTARVAAASDAEPLIRIDHLNKTFHHDGQTVRGVVDVSLLIRPGEALGLVGESGSGKTTLARVLLGLTAADKGSTLEVEGHALKPMIGDRPGNDIRSLQMVFQNPGGSLNRRHSVRRIISRAITRLIGLGGRQREERVLTLAQSVRLDDSLLDVRPAQLSGGLKQRVAIARAFAGEPRLVIADEPTSALDVSVQAAILNLLVQLQAEKGVTYLFISHDLGVVRYLSDRIAVLYLGRLMEVGDAEDVFRGPHHPYTEALLSAAPILKGEARERIRLHGEIPSAASPPSGCVFHTRCPRKIGPICEEQEPPLHPAGEGHVIRCHIPADELRRLQTQTSPQAAPSSSAVP